ncbi:HGxxPAAW family protein [Streptomyces rishiriensis]|uniref:HGxxPAAW family protein n=1 Tax=Streptomyces rishiriensis TaxID=68264 RepID=UPI0033EB579E
MSAHENVDLGHTDTGWAGTALALAGFCVAGVGVIALSLTLTLSGFAVIALAAALTWLVHLTRRGKPTGPRPAGQWHRRVKDVCARHGHPDCLGCRMTARRTEVAAPLPQPASAVAAAPSRPSVTMQNADDQERCRPLR